MDSMKKILTYSFLARLVLLFYGMWQDANMAVKFTDVDYNVFSDAAEFVSQGKSPYLRPTYRYTPLLAWVLSLNVWLSPLFGKILFILFDILVGRTIYGLLLYLGHAHNEAKNCALLWLCNPLTATVSSRGNAESVMVYLVIASLNHLIRGNTVLSAVLYAFAIHVKIYPIIYALPIYLYLGKATSSSHLKCGAFKSFVLKLFPNKDRLVFMAVSGAVLACLTLFFYIMYGWIFIFETYMYHVIRGDIRHNFSPFFYLLYLTSDVDGGVPLCLRLLVFLPQMLLLLSISIRCYKDQPLSWFLCTFVFVMANKVCTSQYFLWYLSLLPIIVPNMKLSLKSAVSTLLLWIAGQGWWLSAAYYLEFEGQNTFLQLWSAGLVFYVINAVVVFIVVTNYDGNSKNKEHVS